MLSGELRRKLCQGQSWRTQLAWEGLLAWPPGSPGHQVGEKDKEEREPQPPPTPFWKAGCQPSQSPKLNISASFSFQKAKLRSM